jgi:pyruvate dehydrogenase E1 component
MCLTLGEVDHGVREMLVEQKGVFYDVTLMNENYAQPDLPEGVAAELPTQF